MSDPWSEWQNDDWSTPAKSAEVPPSNAEIWQKANTAQPVIPFASIDAPVNYKPQVQILKRRVQEPEEAAKAALRKEQELAERNRRAAQQSASREQRYKEVRERLFGADASINGSKSATASRTHSPSSDYSASQPQRQARGPQGSGFASRSKPEKSANQP